MKRFVYALIIALLLPTATKAQVFAELECPASNMWGSMILGLPARLLNMTLMKSEAGGIPMSLWSITSSSVKQNGHDVPVYDNYSFWGITEGKGDDMTFNPIFRDFGYALKVGWQPSSIPVGVYAKIGWRHEAYKLQLESMGSPFRYHTDCAQVGIGLRLSPLRNMLSSLRFAPVFEVGSTYDIQLGWGRLPFENDLDQLNNGLSHHIGAGMRFNNSRGVGLTVMAACDTKKYNVFNTDFEYNGTRPYDGVTTSNHWWSFNITMDY